MSEQDDISALVRSVRARVPMDAAQMLVKETPERIGMVFAELPQMLVERIQAYLLWNCSCRPQSLWRKS